MVNSKVESCLHRALPGSDWSMRQHGVNANGILLHILHDVVQNFHLIAIFKLCTCRVCSKYAYCCWFCVLLLLGLRGLLWSILSYHPWLSYGVINLGRHCYRCWLVSWRLQTITCFNSLRPSDAYMRRQPRTSMLQIMACRLLGAKQPLPELYWNIATLGCKLQWNFNRNSFIFIQKNAFENVVCQNGGHLSRRYELSLTADQCTLLAFAWDGILPAMLKILVTNKIYFINVHSKRDSDPPEAMNQWCSKTHLVFSSSSKSGR